MAAILQVVGAVGSTTAILDLNDNPAGIMVAGGGVTMDLAATNAGDEHAPVWAPVGGTTELVGRTITVPVTLIGATADLLGAKVQTLAKAIDQPWVLRVRRSGATADSWLRCFATSAQLQSSVTGSHRSNTVTGQIVAETEPYAYGARVDITSTAVAQDAGSAGSFVMDVNSVTGDAPTPCVIRINDTTLVTTSHGTLVAVRTSGSPGSLTGFVQSSSDGTGTVSGTGVTVTDPFSDVTFANSSGVRFNFSSSYTPGVPLANYGNLSYTPTFSGAEAPGVYKVLARVRRSDSSAYTITPTIAGSYTLDPVTMAAGGSSTRVLDLGLVQLPAGQSQQLAAPTGVLVQATAPNIFMKVQRQDGILTGTAFDLDWIMLVPADEDLGVIFQNAALTSGWYVTLDGYLQDVVVSNGDPFVGTNSFTSPSVKTDWVGGVPRLTPGSNRLFVVTGLSPLGAGAPAKTATVTVRVSYWPRYSWLA